MNGAIPGRFSAETPGAIIGTVSVGHFLSHVYFLAFPPLFPLLSSEFDVSYAELGLLVSALYAAMFVFQIPVGWAVDRGYAKHSLVAGLLLSAGGLVGAATVTSYATLLAFAFASGVGQATFHPADYALLDTVSTAGRTGRNFSLHTFAGYAGSGVAPILVGGLGIRYGWRLPLMVVGLLGIGYAFAVQFAVEPVYANHLDARDRSGTGSIVREDLRAFMRPSIVAMFLFFVVLIVGESGVQSFTVVYLVETFALSESTGNGALTAFFVLASAGVLAGGILADRYDAGTVVIGFLGLATVLTFVLGSGLVPVTAVVALALFGAIGFAYGVVMPSRDRLVVAYAPDQSVGKSFGLVFTGAAVGGSIGPVLIGTAIDYVNVAVSMSLVAAFFFAGTGIVALVKTGVPGRSVGLSIWKLLD